MADKIVRKFWIIPGDVDEKGKQKEYPQKPSTFILSGLGLAKEPVEVTEEMSPDGEYVQTVDGPEGKRQEIARGVDKNQLDLHNARSNEENRAADNARQDAAAAKAREPSPQTPDEARITAANAAVAEANARKATNPPLIRTGKMTTIGPEGQQAPETVTKEQADYDRQAAADLLARAQQAQENARADARLQIEQGRWTAEQANAAYQKQLDVIRTELQKESLALTRRSQDITLRGQDVSAGVAQRGQDLSFQGGLVSNATDLAQSLIPGYAQPEQWSAIRQGINQTRAIGGQGPLPDFRGGPPPYDPTQFVTGAAQSALGVTPGRYQLPGAPPPVQPGQYQLPQG